MISLQLVGTVLFLTGLGLGLVANVLWDYSEKERPPRNPAARWALGSDE